MPSLEKNMRKNIMETKSKVKYERPPKWYYLGQILLSIITLRFLVDWAKSFAYHQVNHSLGVRLAKIGKETKIHATAFIRHGERVEIGHDCLINHNNVIQGGKATAWVRMGNYVQCGPNVMVFAFNHSTDISETPMILQDYYDADVVIEDDVWIGAGSVITAGVHIGSGCVIGAGSVVTKDMPANTICGGIPCKPIKKRE